MKGRAILSQLVRYVHFTPSVRYKHIIRPCSMEARKQKKKTMIAMGLMVVSSTFA